ncbi:MAG: IS110 family transposase [Acidobacteriota bacterium]
MPLLFAEDQRFLYMLSGLPHACLCYRHLLSLWGNNPAISFSDLIASFVNRINRVRIDKYEGDGIIIGICEYVVLPVKFLLERGITFRRGRKYLQQRMPLILEDAELSLSPLLRSLLDQLWQEWKVLASQIEVTSRQIERIAEEDAACQRLQQIPGVGPLVATAMVAAIGNGSAFVKGREFATWLGLVPRQHSTGGKAKLLGISKRGNPYLRRLFIHGARAVLTQAKPDKLAFGGWMNQSTGTPDAPECSDCRGGQ